MSDLGRQSFTGLSSPTSLTIAYLSLIDKASAAIKPDSEKTTTEHVGDKFKGTGDSVASTLQPQSEKSYGQKIGDTVSGNSNHDDVSL
jgi:hypothetical protein